MLSSVDRILTTHVGSLPRSQAVTDVLFAREQGAVADSVAADRTIRDAVAEVVRRQVDTGIDVVSDGEMSKISYATYIKDRLTGFAGDTPREPGQDLVHVFRRDAQFLGHLVGIDAEVAALIDVPEDVLAENSVFLGQPRKGELFHEVIEERSFCDRAAV